MMHQNAMMLTTGDDETSPFTPLGVVNTPYGQTPQVCAVLCDRMIRSDTHNSTPPNPFARNTTCMAVRSDPERPTDTIRLTRVCEGQDPLLRLGFLARGHHITDAQNFLYYCLPNYRSALAMGVGGDPPFQGDPGLILE